jgi:hypothetical protein
VLNLRTKGLNNAAAVLGGYDAMVKAGLPIETGSLKLAPAPAASNARPAPAAQASQPTALSSQPASPTAAPAQAKRAKKHKAKTRH